MRTATMILAAVVVLLSGCATALVQPHEAIPVPLERQYVQSPSGDHLATVVFVRDRVVFLLGGPIYHQLFVDGKRVATLDKGESFTLRAEPGEHLLGVLPTAESLSDLSLNSSTVREFAFLFDETTLSQRLLGGTTYYFRVLIGGHGMHRLQRFIPDKVH